MHPGEQVLIRVIGQGRWNIRSTSTGTMCAFWGATGT